jgi:hypothetical protein
MSVVLLVAGVVVGSVAFVAAVLAVVVALIRRRLAEQAASLDDVMLDSGYVKMATRFDGFRSPTLIRSGYRRNPARVVLTRTHLHLLEQPQVYGVFALEDLSHFTAATQEGALHLRSTEPPGATGTVDYRIPVSDPDRWVEALIAAGARRPLDR